MNKDLILREELALERTRLAIYRTTLSFCRSAMYFVVAGISLHFGLNFAYSLYWLIGFSATGFMLLLAGWVVHRQSMKKLVASKVHIGYYVLDDDE